jgi:CBS domain-containing protein
MNAADVMTKTVVTLKPEMSIVDAAQTMLHSRVSGLPVVDADGKLVGIVTEGDLLRRSETGTERQRPHWLQFLLGPGRMAEEYTHAHARKVSEVMTERVFQVAPGTPLEQVVAAMEQHHVKRLPVVAGGRMVGIVSRSDLLRALVDSTAKQGEAAGSDSKIRDRILAELDRQGWAPRAVIAVEVKDGHVELQGVITDERERAALRVVAENIPGVESVIDHLVWIEPFSGMVLEPPPESKTD